MITLTGGINDLWKTIRKFIFNHLLEYNTMPRESASAFNLGFYEIIIKPIKKLIKRNLDFTGNEDLNNMLNDCLINVLKQWLIVEPKHTDKVKKMIIDNIEKKKVSDIEEMNDIMEEEYTERLFRGHNADNNSIKKLRKVKSPSMILLISNEPEHEVKERIYKYYSTKEKTKRDDLKNKLIYKICKMETLKIFLRENNNEDSENDINKDNDKTLKNN